ncbi:chemotaxis protein CheB [Curvivirga aplysinae]|uniref:chemotaxis protein CheB n=1 Tax=Curvivirga aplysinae TaxID=2529852 RepID=UPI0012BCA3C0|nr:chemotaxis protein CheB [Curvivirga aplysinae]MTI10619.1 chemotaxis protein CheB [Curvivirga aplysinae]
MRYGAVVIGCSMGGLRVLSQIIQKLPHDFNLPIVVVCHMDSDSPSLLPEILALETPLPVHQCHWDMILEAGHIYIAPPAYHVYLEPDFSFSFSQDPKVSFSRPSIDILFESMGDVLGPRLIAILLTGANADGALGLKHIRDLGGIAIIQDPEVAEARAMPEAGLEIAGADFVLEDDEIVEAIEMLAKKHIRVVEY